MREVFIDESETQDIENNFKKLFCGAVPSSGHPTSAWEVNLFIDLSVKPILFKIDSGADVNIISRETYESRPQLPRLRKHDVVLRSVDAKLDCVGVLRASLRHWRETHTFDVYVVGGNTRSLLGRDVAEKMHLIRRCEEDSKGVDINPDVFGELGHMKCEPFRLKRKEGADPYCVNTARGVPIPMLTKVKSVLERMDEANGVIDRVTVPVLGAPQWYQS